MNEICIIMTGKRKINILINIAQTAETKIQIWHLVKIPEYPSKLERSRIHFSLIFWDL